LFEVSNSVVLQEFESVQLLSALIKGSGCRFGIDHFVLPEKGPEYLQILRPDYLKSNVTYLQDLLYDEETGVPERASTSSSKAWGSKSSPSTSKRANNSNRSKNSALRGFRDRTSQLWHWCETVGVKD
jgi:hypothetical protein